jgi:hypothetical protein
VYTQDTIVTTESNQNSFSGELDEDEINDLQSQVSERSVISRCKYQLLEWKHTQIP